MTNEYKAEGKTKIYKDSTGYDKKQPVNTTIATEQYNK
eukprot:SAG11_NODE_136_length_15118_cov_14.188495_15_plen_38_part_00